MKDMPRAMGQDGIKSDRVFEALPTLYNPGHEIVEKIDKSFKPGGSRTVSAVGLVYRAVLAKDFCALSELVM